MLTTYVTQVCNAYTYYVEYSTVVLYAYDSARHGSPTHAQPYRALPKKKKKKFNKGWCACPTYLGTLDRVLACASPRAEG